MKLYDARNKLPKDLVYETYIRIVYDYNSYNEITRKNMLKEIVETYHNKNFIYYICTKRELDFISMFYKKEIKLNDIKKYSWEIKELDKKYLFNEETLSFYEDYDDILPETLEFYKNNQKDDFPLSMFIVSFTRIHGEVLIKTLAALCTQLYKIDNNNFDNYLGNPLVHFYCDFENFELSFGKEETIYFRDYEDDIYDLRKQRKILGTSSITSIDKQLFEDFYYYGLNYSNPKVKKMYDNIMENNYDYFTLRIIDKCRLLGIPYPLTQLNPTQGKYITEALEEIPCAAMNGVSPKQRKEILTESLEMDEKFTCIPQNNAHLHQDTANKYYYYYFALLEYTNNKFNINDKVKKIFKQEGVNPYEVSDIDEYLWTHKEIIDDFIKDNPFNFNDNDFYYINQFKSGLTNSNYIFVGTDREYAKFLSEDGKIYMVKGLHSDLDKVLDTSSVPYMINTHLLMFENYIIYTGMIKNYELDFGNEFKKMVLKDMKNALQYYHF
jgi:hypothetical protein